MVFISEVYLVWEVLEELSVRGCVQGFRLRLGEEVMNSKIFKDIFKKYSRGTIFENVEVLVEQIPSTYGCECGYFRNSSLSDKQNKRCPRCDDRLKLFRGEEFELVDVY